MGNGGRGHTKKKAMMAKFQRTVDKFIKQLKREIEKDESEKLCEESEATLQGIGHVYYSRRDHEAVEKMKEKLEDQLVKLEELSDLTKDVQKLIEESQE